MTIAVLAEGAWGTAIALLLAHNGYHVKQWCYHKALAHEINTTRYNKRFLPGFEIPKNITAVSSLEDAVRGVEWIFEAIPVQHLRETIEHHKHIFKAEQKWVVLSKGIEQETLLFPTEIIQEMLGRDTKLAVLAGPSFAHDVAEKTITAVTIAAPDCELVREIQVLMQNDYFKPYISTDMVGVQAGAALKNVITLAIGMLDGAGYGDNAKAFILTRGLHEMVQVSIRLGGKQETMYGLSGVGDLVLTAMGSLSKNLKVGRMLAHGKNLQQILDETGFIPEGINSVQSVQQLLEKYDLSLPICNGVYDVIFKGASLHEMVRAVMKEPVSFECEIEKGAE